MYQEEEHGGGSPEGASRAYIHISNISLEVPSFYLAVETNPDLPRA